jgi:predicted nucleic acid-binding protein
MNVVDSSVWIEYFNDTRLADTFEPVILNTKELVVPSVCIFEVYKRLLLENDDSLTDKVAFGMTQGKVVDLDASIAIYAAKVSHAWKLPFGDSIIYAITLLHEAELWTTDKHFKDLPAVHYFETSLLGNNSGI